MPLSRQEITLTSINESKGKKKRTEILCLNFYVESDEFCCVSGNEVRNLRI